MDEVMEPLVERAVKLSMRNREALITALVCSCYFCIRRFRVVEIDEWTDDKATAICPHCSVDAVLPGEYGDAELAACHERWFGSVLI